MQEFLTNYPLPSLLKASWQAAVLILLVLAVQWVFGRRLSPRWRYGLWLLVVARLALPWTIPSPVSVFNLLRIPNTAPAVASLRANLEPPGSPVLQPAPEIPAKRPGDTAAQPAATEPRFSVSWSWVLRAWAAGALALAVCLLVTHYRLWRRIAPRRPLIDAPVMNLLEDCKQAMGLRVPVTLVETGAVGSPSLFGFVRPRLLLPVGLTRSFSEEELRYVFLHELSHIKRRDILTGWLITALQILHWFNPLVWLAFHRMRVDRELACDALALSYANEEENQPYGRTIIKLLEGFGCSAWAPSLAGTVENKNQMKERISMIAKFRKTSQMPALAGVLFIILGLVTLTDAQTDGKPSTPGAAGGQAPNIVATSPAVGATEVDPGLKEITVTFDQDMGKGYSWTGGGPDYPPTPEGQKAEWRDKRTCVLPVKLEAGHYYRVGINSMSYRAFRGAAGVSAEPSAIYFTTQGASPDQILQMQPPKIVATSPAVGATDVDPAVTEISVTFNQEMGGGMSWTGGGSEFPPSPDGQKAQWRDKRTCVLPVKLEAGHFYRVGINSTSYQNFSSEHGLAAQPSAIYFTTQGASDELKAMTLVPQVVSFDPYNGAQNVSPAITELRVTFNAPMGGGCSWCTASDDGADYPKGPAGKRAYWTEDKKTCVLPVELKPGMTYRLSLNAPEYKNFQSAGGVPLEPLVYTFKTSGN
jgi:beta-lactamase regulating signal transducer with metallopeptidase domain